ncbi:hypothetical protein A8709_24595 [Paenibacillus pectinilyticus]|uniref:Nuclease SbcCD subunit C n=1 Tax=Paenibacillus pectinilyticus TaxID=512399 RepID=A0A1C1A986_9BACL|nr:SMC family ATPase [Paenibacillus pectinilyticus]OCT17162.1 hypothetical protein A8709_24595 [Paenibacillus pectinilyticus]
MRPIQLQMSGLQSYRELQTIDFSQLLDAGVFGIFGPTGSGKSSILDAITLSLYGKVERASGGTQAIMNHAEQTLFVSFTFELTNASGTERYRVERQFKRGAEMSINGTIARLLHILGDETIVLADKAGEVNQQVQHILGLSMQDFTRAVVLPQGKFAEFLTLTGKDRRQMLQRLFHLETYGDQLSAKVSSKVKETDSAVKQLAAEQQGLGEATSAALEDANKRLLEAEAEATRSKLHLEQQEKQFEESKQVYQWLKESDGLQQEKHKHEEQSGLIAEKERLIQLAEQAERVVPYLEQHALAQKDVLASQSQLETASAAQVQAETNYEQTTQAFEKAQQELASQEGPLLLRLDQLEQARIIQQELEQVQAQMQRMQTSELEVNAALTKVRAEISKANETKQKAVTKQAELKAQLKLVETDTAKRQLLQTAVQDKKAILLIQEQEKEAKQGSDDRTKAFAAEELSVRIIKEKLGSLQEKLMVWLTSHSTCSENLVQQDGRITSFLLDFQGWKEHQKKLLKHQERHALASRLAEELELGAPCPVCGSTEHPLKTNIQGSSERAYETGLSEDSLQKNETFLQMVKEVQFSNKQMTRRIKDVNTQATELVLQIDAQAGRHAYSESGVLTMQEAAVSLENAMLTESNLRVELPFEKWQQEWTILESVVHSNMSRADECMQTFQDITKAYHQLSSQALISSAQAQAAASLMAEAQSRWNGLVQQVEKRIREWETRFAELSWDAIDDLLTAILENERIAEEIRGRIEKSIPFLEELLANIESLQTAAQEHERTALQLHERLQGLAQLAADKSRQLAMRAPGAAVSELIAEANNTLAQLRQLAQQTKLAHAAAQREQSLAAQRFSAAAEAAAAASRQLAQTERALHSALADNGFASREAAEAAALAPEQRRQWAQLAAEHREREQALRAQLAQLAAKLQGRLLSAAEWAQSQAQLSDAKAGAEAALEARAKAAQGASELAARHLRWCELESQRVEQATQLERLGKLQAVLKANAFVEYLAEEQLMQVSRAASERLGELTRRRYGIEVDSGGGFVIRDDANGGVKRPVGTLSGGETFLTSLALALALSAQIQLKGEYPLEFFFLDEGFGTLDQELLDMVIGALEKLHTDRLAVGVISHVPELRARLVRKLIVQPAEPTGRGSRIVVEGL